MTQNENFAYGLTEEDVKKNLREVVTVKCEINSTTYQPIFRVSASFTMEAVLDVGERFGEILGKVILEKANESFKAK